MLEMMETEKIMATEMDTTLGSLMLKLLDGTRQRDWAALLIKYIDETLSRHGRTLYIINFKLEATSSPRD
jgi:hypothetical protein